ncbi:MAG TPA: hypothetical protein VK772_11715 [Puia sp.]|jgi:hypothetical protein|nr:hypothetical protein [Puia sp.]
MLNKISWSELIWFLVFLLVPYYLVVLSFYYRKEVLAFMRNPVLRRGPGFEAGGHSPEAEPLHTISSHDEISFSVVHDLLEDLKKIFVLAVKTKMVKEELLQAIQVRLKSYPGLHGSDLREDISNHIRIEAKTVCGIALEDADLKQLWTP